MMRNVVRVRLSKVLRSHSVYSGWETVREVHLEDYFMASFVKSQVQATTAGE